MASFGLLYDVLRGLAVIRQLVHSPHARGWFLEGFVPGATEADADAVTPSQLWGLQASLGAAVESRECIVQGERSGRDGLPVVVEYDPLTDAGPPLSGAYREALERAEARCWDVWEGFVEAVRFNRRAPRAQCRASRDPFARTPA